MLFKMAGSSEFRQQIDEAAVGFPVCYDDSYTCVDTYVYNVAKMESPRFKMNV